MSSRRWKNGLDVVATVTIIVASAGLAWRFLISPSARRSAAREIAVPAKPVGTAGHPRLGSQAATAVLIMVSDFQCPFCAKFATSTYGEIVRRFVDTGKLQVFFINNPLDMHPLAPKAAEAALCADEQGGFWGLHDRLFANSQGLSEAFLFESAEAVGLNAARFKACMAGRAAERVAADRSLAKSLGIQGTPSFLFGTMGQPNGAVNVRSTLSGAASFEEFERRITALMAGH